MNDATHQKIWTDCLDRCIALIEQKRAEALRDYAGPYQPGEEPEKLEDPIADALCRLTPEFMEESAQYAKEYLTDLRNQTRDMTADKAQEYVLYSLRGELQSHMLEGVPVPTFSLLLGSMIELDDLYCEAAKEAAPKSGAMLAQEFFDPISKYCDFAEQNMIALESMLEFYQRERKVPEEEREVDLFRLAQRQLVEEGLIPARTDGLMEDKEVMACSERAEEIFHDLLEPYEDALPEQYSPELPWFVLNLSHHYMRQATPPLNAPHADNDNEPALYERVMENLSKIFLRHIDASEDIYAMLDAEADAQRHMRANQPEGFRGRI